MLFAHLFVPLQRITTFLTDMNVLELSEQEIGRRESLQQLREMGINPYPAAEYPTNAFSTEIIDSFQDDAAPREVSIAGRMMSRRVMGKASFVELQDSKGRIQVYITRDDRYRKRRKYDYGQRLHQRPRRVHSAGAPRKPEAAQDLRRALRII